MMSAWQFQTKVLPTSGLIAHHGKVPKRVEVRLADAVPLEELERRLDELPDYWDGFDNSTAVETAIAELLPERESWSSFARMFGEKGKDEIEIWRSENDRLSLITVAFHMSEPNSEFVRATLDCVDHLKCKFLALQTKDVFEPSLASFVTQAEQCSAARFIPSGRSLSNLLA